MRQHVAEETRGRDDPGEKGHSLQSVQTHRYVRLQTLAPVRSWLTGGRNAQTLNPLAVRVRLDRDYSNCNPGGIVDPRSTALNHWSLRAGFTSVIAAGYTADRFDRGGRTELTVQSRSHLLRALIGTERECRNVRRSDAAVIS